MTRCDEIIIAKDNLSKKKKNKQTIATNVMSTASINCYSKKLRLLYFAHSFISIILFYF